MSRTRLGPLLVACIVLVVARYADAQNTPIGSCTRGRATSYTVETTGACGFGSYRDIYTFAPNTIFFNGANACGACFEVSGPLGTHIMMAADECPVGENEQWCSGDVTHFDMDSRAFPTFAENVWGVTYTSIRPIVCPTVGNIAIISGWGSGAVNPSYLQVHFFNHKVPIASVRVTDASISSWVPLARTNYNAFEWDPGRTIVYPVVYEVTSSYGEAVNVSLPTQPAAGGAKVDSNVQFTQWTPVASNTCPSVYEYDIYVNGLNDDGPDHQTAENWNTVAEANLAFTSSLPSNATSAAQYSLPGYQEWGFYTRGAEIPNAEILGVEVQLYTPATQPGLQLMWGEYSDGFIVDFPDITSTWQYFYFSKEAFGAVGDLRKLAFKNSQSSALNSLTVANFRVVPSGDVVIPPPPTNAPESSSAPEPTSNPTPNLGSSPFASPDVPPAPSGGSNPPDAPTVPGAQTPSGNASTTSFGVALVVVAMIGSLFLSM